MRTSVSAVSAASRLDDLARRAVSQARCGPRRAGGGMIGVQADGALAVVADHLLPSNGRQARRSARLMSQMDGQRHVEPRCRPDVWDLVSRHPAGRGSMSRVVPTGLKDIDPRRDVRGLPDRYR